MKERVDITNSSSDVSALKEPSGVHPNQSAAAPAGIDCKSIAVASRIAARALKSLTGEDRSAILRRMAALLKQKEKDILEANQVDLQEAAKNRFGIYFGLL